MDTYLLNHYLSIARDLHYGKKVYEALRLATSEAEAIRIMHTARLSH